MQSVVDEVYARFVTLVADGVAQCSVVVGPEAAFAAFLVIMHSEDGAQKKYLATIKTICEAGELPWERYAGIYDRSLFNDGKPQRFGTRYFGAPT